MSMIVRPARLADLETLVRLNEHVQSLHANAHPALFKAVPDPEQIRSAFTALLEKPEAIWALVETSDALGLGYIYALQQDRPDAWLRPALKVCYIHQLVVAPGARRRGIARQLVDHISSVAQGAGYTRVELDVWSFNTDAKRCFAALGFKVFNERMARA